MCRGKKRCSELAEVPENWDKRIPLRTPSWLEEEIDKFTNAVDLYIQGDRDLCIAMIQQIRSEDFTEWFIEHGQNSGYFRVKRLNTSPPIPIEQNLRDPLRSPRKYQDEVFVRDGYRCRYCGNKLISQFFMKKFIKNLNSPVFQRGSTNLTTHGIIHATWPVADHVHPWNLGGKTNPDNLVASCASCNYGKYNYTIEQLGIDNPFDFPPVVDCWDGLNSKINKIGGTLRRLGQRPAIRSKSNSQAAHV